MINELKKYKIFSKIGSGSYSEVFKAKNKENGNYVAIKKVNKLKYKIDEKFLSKIELMKLLNSQENLVSIIETINTEDYLYIVMELCLINLGDYIKIRKEGLSIQELKEILIQLNNTLQNLKNKNVVFGNLKLSNILICLNKINKITIKLSDFIFSISPEVTQEENLNVKNDIWSLGIIIYYILFKKYPFDGKTEILLNKDIDLEKELKKTNNNDLNDLLNKMLCVDINQRINWEEYFNNCFFQEKPLKCKIDDEIIKGYCNDCKKNFCLKCLHYHCNHKFVPLNKIGMTQVEIYKTQKLYEDIDKHLKKINKIKKEINSFLDRVNKNKENKDIYVNDDDNNFKNYYINYLENIKNNVMIEEELEFMDLNDSAYKQLINKRIEIEL